MDDEMRDALALSRAELERMFDEGTPVGATDWTPAVVTEVPCGVSPHVVVHFHGSTGEVRLPTIFGPPRTHADVPEPSTA